MIKLILMAALLFVSGASMAQKVVIVGDKVIIDCRDMPAGAITTDAKARTTDGDVAKIGTNTLANIGSAESNKTISHYFEVMKVNAKEKTWKENLDHCTNLNSSDSNPTWRLPTHRELQLLHILQESLVQHATAVGFKKFLGEYISATEYSGSSAQKVIFPTGYSYFEEKRFLKYSRCVRDLTPTTK